MQVVIFYHTKALRDLKTKDIALRAFVPPWETFFATNRAARIECKRRCGKIPPFCNDSLSLFY
jgi:hypothetical protein